MAWTQSDVDAFENLIRAAIADGTALVRSHGFGDQSTEFLSIADAWELLGKMKAAVAAATGGLTKYVQTSKGV